MYKTLPPSKNESNFRKTQEFIKRTKKREVHDMTTKKIGVKETKERGEKHGLPILFSETRLKLRLRGTLGLDLNSSGVIMENSFWA